MLTKKKSKLAVATNLLLKTDFSLAEIANLVEMDVGDVQNLADKIRSLD